MSLYLLAQIRNHSLRRLGEQLRQRERSHALDRRSAHDSQRQGNQEVHFAFAHHVIHQELRRRRQYQTRQPIDGHQHQAEQQKHSLRTQKRPSLLQQMRQPRGLALGRNAGRWRPRLRLRPPPPAVK